MKGLRAPSDFQSASSRVLGMHKQRCTRSSLTSGSLLSRPYLNLFLRYAFDSYVIGSIKTRIGEEKNGVGGAQITISRYSWSGGEMG
ncbi:hypothetical protein J6590_075233 [Homalodisca vitripennis]|nr:hypothetical protein J6590_075233 [Homalodisca vitripennis]